MFRKANRFVKGSGVYTCRCCKHNTRDTGGDGSGVGLCDTCYELAGYDNIIQNNEELSKSDIENIIGMIAFIKKRNNGCEYWDGMLTSIVKICEARAKEESK